MINKSIKNNNGKAFTLLLILGFIIAIGLGVFFGYKTGIQKVSNSDNNIENNNFNNKENESKDIIVLYRGLDISVDDMELSIPDTEENRKKYAITYYNYENGTYIGECEGNLEEIYENYLNVSNTSKIALSQKYNAIPRNFTEIEELPEELMEFADCNMVEIQSIDLDGDNKLEYVVAYASFASPENYDVEKYTNYSEILVFDNNFKKIDTLIKAEDQYWEINGNVTDEYFCSLDDVEYIDIDNDEIMEIIVDKNVYEGIGVNVYKYENGKIIGDTDCSIVVLP